MSCPHVIPSHRLQIFLLFTGAGTDCSSVDTHRVTGLARKSAPHVLLSMGCSPCKEPPSARALHRLHPQGTSTCQGMGLPKGCSVGALSCRKGMCFPTGCRASLLWHLEYSCLSFLDLGVCRIFYLPFFPHFSLS